MAAAVAAAVATTATTVAAATVTTSGVAAAVTMAAMTPAITVGAKTVTAMTVADARAFRARVEFKPLNLSLATRLAPAAPLRVQLVKHAVIVLLTGRNRAQASRLQASLRSATWCLAGTGLRG